MAETFLSSTAVQVYPCAYRGTNTDGELYNPEAQLNTEFNLTNIKNIDGKKSWVISWEETSKRLKCVIGGYYFDLDLSAHLDTTFADSTSIYAYIKVLPMAKVDDTNTTYPAYTLSDVDETEETTTGTSLDIIDENDTDKFKGVKLVDSYPTDENIIVLHALDRRNNSEPWRVNSAAWLLCTNNIIDVAEEEPISSTFTTLHLVGAETGEIEELKVAKIQSYLNSQSPIDIISDVNIPTLGVDIITTRNEPLIAIDKPVELRTYTNEGDVNFLRVVNENPESTDIVYIDNTVVQAASQSQDLVSSLSKSGVTTLNKKTTGQYQLTGSELTSHSLLLGYLDFTDTMDLHIMSELSAEELKFTNDTEQASLEVQSIAFAHDSGQETGALTPYNVQFQDAGEGVTTYRVDKITRRPLGSQEFFTLNIPSKNGTIATLEDFMGGSINTVTPGSDGTVKLFGDNPPTKTQSYVTFTLRILLPSNNSISLGTLCLKNDTTKYSFLCGYLSKQVGGTNYLYNGYAILIDTFDDWKLTLLKSIATGTQDVYTPYTLKDINIEVSDYTENLVKQK